MDRTKKRKQEDDDKSTGSEEFPSLNSDDQDDDDHCCSVTPEYPSIPSGISDDAVSTGSLSPFENEATEEKSEEKSEEEDGDESSEETQLTPFQQELPPRVRLKLDKERRLAVMTFKRENDALMIKLRRAAASSCAVLNDLRMAYQTLNDEKEAMSKKLEEMQKEAEAVMKAMEATKKENEIMKNEIEVMKKEAEAVKKEMEAMRFEKAKNDEDAETDAVKDEETGEKMKKNDGDAETDAVNENDDDKAFPDAVNDNGTGDGDAVDDDEGKELVRTLTQGYRSPQTPGEEVPTAECMKLHLARIYGVTWFIPEENRFVSDAAMKAGRLNTGSNADDRSGERDPRRIEKIGVIDASKKVEGILLTEGPPIAEFREGKTFDFKNLRFSPSRDGQSFVFELTKGTVWTEDIAATMPEEFERKKFSIDEILEFETFRPAFGKVDTTGEVVTIGEYRPNSGQTVTLKSALKTLVKIKFHQGLRMAGVEDSFEIGEMVILSNVAVRYPITSIKQMMFFTDISRASKYKTRSKLLFETPFNPPAKKLKLDL